MAEADPFYLYQRALATVLRSLDHCGLFRVELRVVIVVRLRNSRILMDFPLGKSKNVFQVIQCAVLQAFKRNSSETFVLVTQWEDQFPSSDVVRRVMG